MKEFLVFVFIGGLLVVMGAIAFAPFILSGQISEREEKEAQERAEAQRKDA